jgi:hypothetical protein
LPILYRHILASGGQGLARLGSVATGVCGRGLARLSLLATGGFWLVARLGRLGVVGVPSAAAASFTILGANPRLSVHTEHGGGIPIRNHNDIRTHDADYGSLSVYLKVGAVLGQFHHLLSQPPRFQFQIRLLTAGIVFHDAHLGTGADGQGRTASELDPDPSVLLRPDQVLPIDRVTHIKGDTGGRAPIDHFRGNGGNHLAGKLYASLTLGRSSLQHSVLSGGQEKGCA